MSRWDYDTVFYRVFCITLLAVAFTFTVILTNVFVDIDGLLYRKDKAKQPKPDPAQNDIELMNENILPSDDKSEDVYEDKDYQDSNDLYRSKRSLESPDLLFHIKDPTLKRLLAHRLANILDVLDEEKNHRNDHQNDASSINHSKKDKSKLEKEDEKNGKRSETNSAPHINALKVEDKIIKKSSSEDLKHYKSKKKSSIVEIKKKTSNNLEEELLHLAMHNVVLQGIIGNMNLDDVYTKVADLVENYDIDHAKRDEDEFRRLFKGMNNLEKHNEPFDDVKLFDKHLKDLEKLRDSKSTTSSLANKENANENKFKYQSTSVKPKGHNIMIKTIIDITALTNDKANKESEANLDLINGFIKLIYNGKSMNFQRVHDDNIDNSSNNILHNSSAKITENTGSKNIALIDENYHQSDTYVPSQSDTYVPSQSYYRKTIHDYLNRFPTEDSLEHDKVYSRKRLKRHIKIRFDSDKTTEKPNVTTQNDELFVEIETHFDSKGAKGEKKKKLVRDLIKKIKNAIYSDKVEKKKKHPHWHVKKRTQETLGGKNTASFINKLLLPLQTQVYRHIDAISKSVPLHEDMPLVSDDSGRNRWQKKNQGPGFFDKAINSAEMSTVDVDYDKVMTHNGIPQRLQKPLNTDMSDEVLHNSTIYDLGNIKFLMKDIGGSGFSIGFNQYMDQAPDQETMKIFSGLENVIQTYHQKYDSELGTPDSQQFHQLSIEDDNQNYNHNYDYEYYNYENQQIDKPDKHFRERRSIKKSQHKPDHHPNKYKVIVSNYHNFLPYDSYQEIYDYNKQRKNIKLYHKKQANTVLVIDDKVFEKHLKPGEILSIADLFQRRKRSFNVPKISNIKIKNKISRYLNTKSMASKSFFLNKKRNKRQIDKIRIVARDLSIPNRNSAEDFFVVSDEKVFADRAVVSEVEVPEIQTRVKMQEVDHYDLISPQKEEDPYDFISQSHQVTEDHFDIVSPYIYESPYAHDAQNEFTRHARHNNLMSKYPHIFMEEMARSKEDIIYPENTYTYFRRKLNVETTTNTAVPVVTMIDTPVPDAQQIAQLLSPPKDNSNNYKVTVKIRPKNSTGLSGFKEVHTSINKSYNKNGLIYTSLVNVSQLSKVEKLNKNISRRDNDNDIIHNLKQQQDIVKRLISQQKSRIDDRLKQLYLEKEKLETMDIENTELISDVTPETFIDIAHPTDPKKKLHLTKDEESKLFNFDETTSMVANTPVTQDILTSPTVITTTEYESQTTKVNVKNKIIETIERNENITNEILKKIDQNTGVLKTFLGKLIAKMDVSYRKHSDDSENSEGPVFKSIYSNMSNNDGMKKKVINNDMPFNFEEYQKNIDNTFFNNLARQSNNHTGIPFVYAYQQPYRTMSNKESPIASVVYYGHIYTNKMNDKDPFYKTDNTITKYYVGDYKPDARKTQYFKQDNQKQGNHKPENTNPEYYKLENIKPEYYKPENTKSEYYKPENTNSEYYKTETSKPEYYKQGNAKAAYYKAKKNKDPDKRSVLKENDQNLNKEQERKMKDIEKEFWNAKPGETVLQNFAIKNSTKFFMDDNGRDFKIYTPLRNVDLNVTKV